MKSIAHRIPAVDTNPTGRLPHAVVDPNTPVFGADGQPTPEGAAAIDRLTKRIIREANRTPDPQKTLRLAIAALPDAMAAWAAGRAITIPGLA
ncbi:hypothetical protein NC239_14825 [Streptomyces sp. G3]|uniref:hypothetical protein n=1 Tax=Streptomyces sp. G3 TaxID=690144 RepID=UPI00202E9D90|nr:hypothetical protein [Streptomyces sp. G3]MCM1939490.1 hypothetical protein [Streptomyces sp. G3]